MRRRRRPHTRKGLGLINAGGLSVCCLSPCACAGFCRDRLRDGCVSSNGPGTCPGCVPASHQETAGIDPSTPPRSLMRNKTAVFKKANGLNVRIKNSPCSKNMEPLLRSSCGICKKDLKTSFLLLGLLFGLE